MCALKKNGAATPLSPCGWPAGTSGLSALDTPEAIQRLYRSCLIVTFRLFTPVLLKNVSTRLLKNVSTYLMTVYATVV